MDELEKQVLEILDNVNWLMEPHNSYAKLEGIKGRKVIIECIGPCVQCKIDCIREAFKERMPTIELIRKRQV